MRFLVGALTVLFRRDFRFKHGDRVAEIAPGGFVRTPSLDLALDWTIAFVPVRGDSVGMPSEHLHRGYSKYRLESMTRFDDKLLDDVHALMDFDRPFVPLEAATLFVRSWPFETPSGPVAEFEKDTAPFWVFADRVDSGKARALLRALEQGHKPLTVTTRRCGWCVVYIFNFA